MIEEQFIGCPYCGETVSVLVDCSLADQCYVEDCQVCCSPMLLTIVVEDGAVTYIEARRENE